jgi:hypothetical protein
VAHPGRDTWPLQPAAEGDAEGKPLSVREALALINQTLDEALAEQEGDFDADSRWALTWFEQSGFDEGEYGVAEQLSKSKVTSVAGRRIPAPPPEVNLANYLILNYDPLRLVLFTEHRDTLNYLESRITTLLGRKQAVVMIHGGMGREAATFLQR